MAGISTQLDGLRVKYLSADPSGARATGEVWYNSTTGNVASCKYYIKWHMVHAV